MNELINFIILGMIQGLTEFFPVSSSGHLVLFQDILSINNEGASAEIIAHFGTLFSILLFYIASFFTTKNESDFFHINTLKLLVISTIPAVICGLIFDFEQFFNYQFVQYSLLANGCLIIVMSLLKNSVLEGYNMNDPKNYESIIKSITLKDVEDIAKKLMKDNKSYEIVFKPKQ